MNIEKLITDPDWGNVERLVQGYVDKMLDMTTIDVSKDAEDVKAQVIGRMKAYESMTNFLADAKIISKPSREGVTNFR